MPTKTELREVAATLALLLEKIASGELTAPPGLVAKLEDAHRTVEALAVPERPGRRPY